ncbi:hypothetical protein EDF34_0350 [Cellulomonas sp. PhB150]|nr:hypothetical protein EDF34_0350 [Cellulomonas sp. PhB150]
MLLAGCSSDPEPADAPSASPTTSATPTPTADDAQAEAAVAEVVEKYVAAMASMENEGQVDPAPMFGIASDAVAKEESARVKDLVDQGIHREGHPTLGEPTITVDGTTARYEVCMNQDGWVGVYEDQKLATEYGPLPTGWDLTLADDAWTVTATVPDKDVTLTC